MDVTKLSTIIALIVALSVASERLVEIIKGLVPFLNEKNTEPKKEGWRKAALQALAVISGVITAFLARPAIPKDIYNPSDWAILAFGLLASGGSGFWNSVLIYITSIKDLKKLEFEERQRAARNG